MTNSFSGKAYGVPLQLLLVSAADAVAAVAPTCLDLLFPISQLLGGSQSDDLGSSACLPARARVHSLTRALDACGLPCVPASVLIHPSFSPSVVFCTIDPSAHQRSLG